MRVGAVGGVVVCLALALGLVAGSASEAPVNRPAAGVAAVPPGLTDHELAGQRFVAGFSGTSVPRPVKKAILSLIHI